MPAEIRIDSQEGRGACGPCGLLLTADAAAARNINRARALEDPAGAFAAVVQTADGWVAKLWEMEGDGRAFAAPYDKAACAAAVVAAHDFRELEPAAGLAGAIVACANRASGIPAFDRAVQRARQAHGTPDGPEAPGLGGLSPQEREFLCCVGAYSAALAEAGLVDRGGALAFLAAREAEVFPRPVSIAIAGGDPLPAALESFIGECPALGVESRPEPTGPLQPPEGIGVSMAFPSGGYARGQLVLNAIAALREQGCATIAVAAGDPRALFEAIAPALAGAGLSAAVSYRKPLAATALGRAFLAARRVAAGSGPLWDREALGDLLRNAALAVAKGRAWRVDARIRGDRLLACEELFGAEGLLAAEGADGPWDRIDALGSGADGEGAAAALEALIGTLRAAGAPEAFVREQMLAGAALQQIAASAARFPACGASCAAELAEGAALALSAALYPEGEGGCPGEAPRVQIMDARRLAQLPPRSVDAVYLADLTTAAYPLGRRRTAIDGLLEALGVPPEADELQRERRRFAAQLAVAKRRAVLEFPLNDAAGEPFYASAMLSELAAAYRAAAPGGAERYGFPETLAGSAWEWGEEDLEGDWQPVYPGRPAARGVVRAGGAACGGVLAPHEPGQMHPELPRLSPSQVENYLDCPGKWFIANRLGTQGLDEGFGPLETGSFLHELFRLFYSSFGRKVCADNLGEARNLMFGADGQGGLWARAVAAQYERDAEGRPLPNRLAALPGTSEELEMQDIRRRVERWLLNECTFLPGFTPLAFECRIDGVAYGGAEIRGVIDRIDADGQGRFAIIDYKGALKDAFRPLAKGELRADAKVQALMYARMVQQAGAVAFAEGPDGEASFIPAGALAAAPRSRTVPLDRAVAALYVSYNAGGAVAGALDGTVLGAAAVPALAGIADCVLPAPSGIDFTALLDFAEGRTAEAATGIAAGRTAPEPAGAGACTHCPDLTCPRRLP